MNKKSGFLDSLTARRLREKALPDEFRPEGRIPLSGQDVLRPEKEGMARYLRRRVRLVLRSRYKTKVYK